MGIGRIAFQNAIKTAVSEGSHMKVFRDGTVGRLVDYVENGVRKSRLVLTDKEGRVIDRLTTRMQEAGHRARTSHTTGTSPRLPLGEAYTEGSYKTIDRFYNADGSLNAAIEGHTTPTYQRQYGHFTFNIYGQRPKDIPWYQQWGQYADVSHGQLDRLTEGIAGCGGYAEIPVTENLRKEYKILENLATK